MTQRHSPNSRETCHTEVDPPCGQHRQRSHLAHADDVEAGAAVEEGTCRCSWRDSKKRLHDADWPAYGVAVWAASAAGPALPRSFLCWKSFRSAGPDAMD